MCDKPYLLLLSDRLLRHLLITTCIFWCIVQTNSEQKTTGLSQAAGYTSAQSRDGSRATMSWPPACSSGPPRHLLSYTCQRSGDPYLQRHRRPLPACVPSDEHLAIGDAGTARVGRYPWAACAGGSAAGRCCSRRAQGDINNSSNAADIFAPVVQPPDSDPVPAPQTQGSTSDTPKEKNRTTVVEAAIPKLRNHPLDWLFSVSWPYIASSWL